MTQTANAPASQTPSDEDNEPHEYLARVLIIGAQAIYERGKLWPQGPTQTAAAQVAYEVDVIEKAVAKAPQDRDLRTKLETAKAALEKARAAITGSDPILCTVGEMFEVDGSPEIGVPAKIEIFGVPFGPWEQVGASITAEVPQERCIWETAWPIKNFMEHYNDVTGADGEDEDEEEQEEEEETEDPNAPPPPPPAAP